MFFWERHWKAFFFVSLYHSFPSGALELLPSFVFVTQEYYLIRNMRICLILILFSPFFPHRTAEDITQKYPREPEMRYNSTLTSPVCKEICSTSFPRVSKYGKELHHLLTLPAKEKRSYFLHRKTAWFSRTIQIVFKEISSDWLKFLCWIRFREI